MASIYLIRHGQASFGAENYDQLSVLGQRQADLTGQFFAAINQRFDAAFCGSLSRQRETGERVLASQVNRPELIIDERFNEIDNDAQVKALLPGLCEQDAELAALVGRDTKSSKDYQKIIDAVFNAWVDPNCTAQDLTAWPHYRDGVNSAMADIMQSVGSGKDTAVFTSGGTIATAVGLVAGVTHEGFYQFYEPVMNCSVTRFIYSGQRVSLSNFNDIAHLQLLGAQLGESLVTYR